MMRLSVESVSHGIADGFRFLNSVIHVPAGNSNFPCTTMSMSATGNIGGAMNQDSSTIKFVVGSATEHCEQ